LPHSNGACLRPWISPHNPPNHLQYLLTAGQTQDIDRFLPFNSANSSRYPISHSSAMDVANLEAAFERVTVTDENDEQISSSTTSYHKTKVRNLLANNQIDH
jgi:hypothetical protein